MSERKSHRPWDIRRRLCDAAFVGLGSVPAGAHGIGPPIGPGDLWRHWSLEPYVIIPLALGLWLYGRGVQRLWRRAGPGRGVSVRRAGAFLAGVIALIIALVSPIDPLGGTLLGAHMLQHGILIVVAPPLLLAGLPGAVIPRAVPAGLRRSFARSRRLLVLRRGLSWMVRPLPAAALHGATLWIWHAPVAFQAALASAAWHGLEHITFLATALLFWHSIVAASRGRLTAGAGAAAALVTMMHGGFLGAMLTFAPNQLYGWYAERGQAWGVTALEDQQLAGLLMWVPMGLAYLVAGLAIAARVLKGDTIPHRWQHL